MGIPNLKQQNLVKVERHQEIEIKHWNTIQALHCVVKLLLNLSIILLMVFHSIVNVFSVSNR